jgi:hypothetical protein
MREITRTLVVLLVVSFALTVAACGTSNSSLVGSGTSNSSLVGKWLPSEGAKIGYGSDFPSSMEFFSDGTLVTEGGTKTGYNGTYSIVDGKLKLTADGQARAFGYEIRGSRLTLTYANNRAEYTKQ